MFTGIIEELGKIQYITSNKIEINASRIMDDVKLGDSISVNGVCLTVSKLLNSGFFADISPETLKMTSFSKLKSGCKVNLERAMILNGRFGGHIVTGHIDGICKCKTIRKIGEFYNIAFELNNENLKYIAKKGSVTIDGISLTVADIINNIVTIAVIPHTFENTTLSELKVGDFVNIETDILAKYVEKFLLTGDNRSGINKEFLLENGF